jgi:regulator of replication initiation timing
VEIVNSKERIAYLRGLLDSMPREEREVKIYSAIVDALDALALEMEEHAKQIDLCQEDYEDLVEEVDDLHKEVYELEESMGVDDIEEDYDDDEDEEDLEELTESYISMTCPSCAYSFYYKYEDGKENDKLVCPSCGEEFSRSL